MKSGLVSLLAVAAIAGAQGARALARQQGGLDDAEPFAPSPATAPMLSLGYREAAADLLFFRLVGYFGGHDYTARGVADLVEAINALDPHHQKIYEWGALAIMVAGRKEQDATPMYLRAIALLDRAATQYPNDYRYPQLAGEIYVVDLVTKDPQTRRRWDELGVQHLEAAVFKPSSPASLGPLIATLRTKLGQNERAKAELRSLITITDDEGARAQLLSKLADLEGTDSAELAAEILEARKRFNTAWRRDRTYMQPGLYILTGPTPPPGFDLGDLATGGHALVDLSDGD